MQESLLIDHDRWDIFVATENSSNLRVAVKDFQYSLGIVKDLKTIIPPTIVVKRMQY